MAFSVDDEVHAKFEIWCRRQNRSLRGALRQMVTDAVVGVTLPSPEKKEIPTAQSDESERDRQYRQIYGTPRPPDEPRKERWPYKPFTLTPKEVEDILEFQVDLDANRYFAARTYNGDSAETAEKRTRMEIDNMYGPEELWKVPPVQKEWEAARQAALAASFPSGDGSGSDNGSGELQ
jgi:hypothetical protein